MKETYQWATSVVSAIALGLEFFDEVLLDYGDTGGPLWDALAEFQEAPPWTTRPCGCGSGLPFRDCCMERENTLADEGASALD